MSRIEPLSGLATEFLGRPCICLDEVNSTNDYLKERAAELPHGAAVIAGFQHGGKGRRGKRWQAPQGTCLALSVLLKEDMEMCDLPRLPLLAGLGVCRALGERFGTDFAIKWSNDVLHSGKKICGILCESRILPGSKNPCAIVGIGINLLQTHEDFLQLDLVYATSLFLVTGQKHQNKQVAAPVLNQFEKVLQKYRSSGFGAVRDEYERVCLTVGREVQIVRDGGQQRVFAKGIDSDGGLVCVDAEGLEFVVRSGETSVRGLYGYV